MPSRVLARLAAATRAGFRVEGVGEGTGAVEASRDGGALVLRAEGAWADRPVRWRTTARWQAEGEALAVAWVRPGAWARVTLDRGADGLWRSRQPHVCGADRYAAVLRVGPEAVEVAWTIRGPAKAAEVVMRYA